MLKNGRGSLWQGLLLAGLLALTGVANASAGSFLYEQNRNMEAWLADLEEHSVTVKGVRWTYYARHLDKGSCAVFVHGFTAEAANWFRFARHLEKDSCLVVPDLPGFGRSGYQPAWDFSVPAQAARLHDFLQSIRAQGPYHFVGSSMGGHIVLTYTLKYPGEVASLALVDAAGVMSPNKSDHAKQMETTGRTVFDVRQRGEFANLIAMGMHDAPWLPGVVRDHLADEFIARNARYQGIFKAIFGKDMLDARLAEITTPTLVLWGDRDRLLDVSMAAVFHRGISGSRIEVMKDIGHLPFLEAPGESAEIYRRFRQGLPAR